ncbi:helix-turn-helix transcriptional regulator [Salmonella enterica]|nr:helix-turn-helix transcriptional regulator [Salmonella enterica]
MIPERLKYARKLRGYTQERLGINAGIEESTATSRISQYESGTYSPDFNLVQNIAKVLRVPACYFYCDDEELAEYLLYYYER